MQLIAVATALFAAIAAVEATPVEVEARQIFYCGRQPYKKTDYTCYPQNNNLLCPILSGVVYKPCGKACYDPANYGCANGQLYQVNSCSGIPFDKNSYVCVDGQLCPKTAPNRCGAACYNLTYYWCDNGVLKQQGQK